MNTLKYEYEKAANAFGVEDRNKILPMVVLAPIAVPMAAFWGIADFLTCTLPDFIFGIKDPPPPKDGEFCPVAAQILAECEQERLMAVAEIKQNIFGHLNQ